MNGPLLLVLLLLSVRRIESILYVPRSSFQQSASETINAVVYTALRLVAFLDGVTAVAALLHLASIIVDDANPSVSSLVRNSILSSCCCFQASRLRFWQYDSLKAWWLWVLVDWIVLTAGVLMAHIFSRPGAWFLALVNAAAWCVHQHHFRQLPIGHANLVDEPLSANSQQQA
jgi:hypothetical protein